MVLLGFEVYALVRIGRLSETLGQLPNLRSIIFPIRKTEQALELVKIRQAENHIIHPYDFQGCLCQAL